MIVTDEKAKLYDNILVALLINFNKNNNLYSKYIVNMDAKETDTAKFLYHFLKSMKPILGKDVKVKVKNWFKYFKLVITKQIYKGSRTKKAESFDLFIKNPYEFLSDFFEKIDYHEDTPWQKLIADIYNGYYSMEKKK